MRGLVLALLLTTVMPAEHRWDMQFFHDVDGEQMRFQAIAFCSPKRGIAAAVLTEDSDQKPVAMVTSDAGTTWSQTKLDEPARSLYFFDETSGWMLTESGIWFSDECGRSWRRVHKQRGLIDIRFVSREKGWAVGANKLAIQTVDGGKTWTKVKAVEELASNSDTTAFEVIEPITSKVAIMVGRSVPRRRSDVPLWLDTDPQKRRETPSLTLTLETRDAGDTWTANKVSMFGRISQLRVGKDGQGLALVEFDQFFEFPSELFSLDVRTGKNSRVLRRKDVAITDILATPMFIAAGFRPSGALFRTPVPGKVRMLHSKDMVNWTECEVDYRAVATDVSLAESGGRVWAATDTGMILTLSEE